MEIDICLVAGRRPELLSTTLDSFHAGLFSKFRIKTLIANIDPVFGNRDDHRKCVEIIRSYFPSATIIEPEKPNFCAAVRTVWRRSKAKFLFHLEDDWLLNRPITDGDIIDIGQDASLAQISFNTREKNWDRRRRGWYHYARRKICVLGAETPLTRKFPRFTTSPSFLRGDFARTSASLMDTTLDPEKQFYSRVNSELEAFVAPYRNYVVGDAPQFWISDIGREWRDRRGIEKRIINNNSVWIGEQ